MMTKFIEKWVLALFFVAAAASAQPKEPNLMLGNPSGATTDQNNKDNYLLIKRQYTLSYSSKNGTPNWVSWTLKASDIGDVERQTRFYVETDLPPGFQRVRSQEYTHSDYDRGHMCNSKDRTDTEENNKSTFSMVNIQPQIAALNRGPWKNLEVYSRLLAENGNTLYIIAGCYGSIKHIGSKNTINVPERCWKLEEVNGPDSQLIVVDMPNDEGPNKERLIEKDWHKYIVKELELEHKTGYHFEVTAPSPSPSFTQTIGQNEDHKKKQFTDIQKIQVLIAGKTVFCYLCGFLVLFLILLMLPAFKVGERHLMSGSRVVQFLIATATLLIAFAPTQNLQSGIIAAKTLLIISVSSGVAFWFGRTTELKRWQYAIYQTGRISTIMSFCAGYLIWVFTL